MSKSKISAIHSSTESSIGKKKSRVLRFLQGPQLFFPTILVAAISVATAGIGDHKIEVSESEKAGHMRDWAAFTLEEDSVHALLGQFGQVFDKMTNRSEDSKADLHFRKWIAEIAHQSEIVRSKLPKLDADEIDTEIAVKQDQLSETLDSLDLDISQLALSAAKSITDSDSAVLEVCVSTYTSIRRCTDRIRMLRRQILSGKMAIHSEARENWQSAEWIVNAVATTVIFLTTLIGIFMTKKVQKVEQERARQFDLLKQSDNRFRSVVSNVPGAIFRSRIQPDWPVEFISEHIERISGYPASDFIENSRRKFGSIIHPADVERMNHAVQTSIEAGTPYDLQYRIIHANGSVVWLSEKGLVACDEFGVPKWIDGALFDVTDQKKSEEALEQSEETLRALIDASPGVALLINQEGIVLAANDFVASMAESDRAELQGRLLYLISSSSVVHSIWERFREVVDSGRQCDYVQFVDEKYTHLHLRPVFDSRGQLSRVAIFGQDITDLRVALNEAERYKSVLDQTADIVAIADSKMKVIYTNAAAKKQIGTYPGDVLSEEYLLARHSREAVNLMMNVGIPHSIEHSVWQGESVILTTDKREIPTSQVMLARKSESGEVEYIATIMRDLSERKQVEFQLAEKNNQLREMLNAIPLPVFYKDTSLSYLGCNAAFERFLGVKESEMVGRGASDLIPKYLLSLQLEQDKRVLALQAESLMDATLTRADGEERQLIVHKAPLRDTRGNSVGVVGVLMDITERKQMEEALRKHERHLTEITGGIPGLVYQFLLKPDGSMHFPYASSGSKMFFGVTPEQAMNDAASAFKAIHPEDFESLFAAIHESAQTLREFDHEFRIVIGTRTRWVRASSIPQRLPDGSTLWNGLLLDKTAQKTAEEQLKTLVESAIDGIITYTRDGKIESANPAAERMFSMSQSKLIASSMIDLIAEPHRSKHLELLEHPDSDLASGLLRGVHEVLGVKSDGFIFPMDLAISPLKLGEGLKFVAIVRDITGRKLAEQKIVENEAKLEALLSSAGDGIIVADSALQIQIFNTAASAIFGYSAKQVIDRPLIKIMPDMAASDLPAKGQRLSWETTGLDVVGDHIPLQLSVSCVSIGGTESYTIIARDLTEENIRREQLMEADKFTSIGTLAAGIAHEFKNYLAGIIGNASFAMDNLDESDGLKEAREAFEQIINIGEKANEIALSLLTYSGRHQNSMEMLDLRDTIMSTLKFVNKDLTERSIVVETDFGETPRILASGNRIQQVVLNLIINATHAIKSGGHITISLQRVGEEIQLVVQDDGIGIAAENLKRIFDPFFSTKGVWGKDAVHGTGLGLFISRNIVSSFGGTIEVESEVGKGSSFKVTLPMPGQIAEEGGPVGDSPTVAAIVLFSGDSRATEEFQSSCDELGIGIQITTTDRRLEEATTAANTLFVADCGTPFKSELFRSVEYCSNKGVPVVLINIGASSIEFQHLSNLSIMTFKDIPEVREILAKPGIRLEPLKRLSPSSHRV